MRDRRPSSKGRRKAIKDDSLKPGTGVTRETCFTGFGMGEVYKARDTRLDRDVTVKVLPEALARDPEALPPLTKNRPTPKIPIRSSH